MRWSWALVGLALLAWAASADAGPLVLTDPSGDVVQGGQTSAVAVDIREARVAESGPLLEVTLQVAATPGATYQVGFVRGAGDSGILLRAIPVAAVPGLPSTGWRFLALDRATGTELPVLGSVGPAQVAWQVLPSSLGMAPSAVLGAWEAQAWVKPPAALQAADGANTTQGYQLGVGAVEAVPYEPPFATPGAWTAFIDPANDVDGGRPEGEAAADVLAARVGDDGTSLLVELELRDLAGLAEEAKREGFHAQYALCFAAQGEHCFRATYREEWVFNVHHVQADAWPEVEGHALGNSLLWIVPSAQFGLKDGQELGSWSLQSWNSYEDEEQYGDWAGSAASTYTIGASAPQLAFADQVPASLRDRSVPGRPGVWRGIDDPVGDVHKFDDADPEPLAASATDIVRALVWESGNDLWFELELDDLSTIGLELQDDEYSVQYALSFKRPGHEGYSMRASFGGAYYTREPQGAWDFKLHDWATDEWPAADGRVDGDRLVWRIPKADLGVAEGTPLSNWTVSTWASFESKGQYGDRAEELTTYVVGSLPGTDSAQESAKGQGAGGQEAKSAAPLEGAARAAPMPAVLLGLALTLGAAALRRRA